MLADLFSELVLAIGGFTATNLENVVVLVSVFCGQCGRAHAVRLGFALGSVALLALSLLGVVLVGLVPVQHIGWLGLIPIALGVRELLRKSDDGSESDATGQRPEGSSLLNVAGAAAVLMVANGGDTVAVFAPLFAETQRSGIVVLAIGFLATALLLTLVTGRACNHPALSVPLQRFGPRIAPYVMIAIGAYVLLNTGTDTLPG